MMKTYDDCWVREFEQSLALEARNYLQNRNCNSGTTERLRGLILSTTGYEITSIDHQEIARDRLQSLIATQKRWARARHPSYDVNRHIALRQALNGINEMLCLSIHGDPPKR